MSINHENRLNWSKFWLDFVKFILTFGLSVCAYMYLKSEESIFNKTTKIYDRISNIIFSDKSTRRKEKELDFMGKYFDTEEIYKKILSSKEYVFLDTISVSLQKQLDTINSNIPMTKKILKNNIAFINKKQETALAAIFNPNQNTMGYSNTNIELEFFSVTDGLIEWKPRWAKNEKFVFKILDSFQKVKAQLKEDYFEMNKLPDDPFGNLPQLAGSKFQAHEGRELNKLRETIKKMDSVQFLR